MSTDPSKKALERVEAIVKAINTRPKLTLLDPGNGTVQGVRQMRQKDNARPFKVIATSLPDEDEMAGYISQRWRLDAAVEVKLTRGGRDHRALTFEVLKLARLIVEALTNPNNWNRPTSGIDNINPEGGGTEIEDDGAALILTVPFNILYTEL